MVLVTGATGHIGNVLVKYLVESGETVRALYAPGDNPSSLAGLSIDRREVDILDAEAVRSAIEGVDTVYHLAGLISILPFYQKRVYEINVGGTENIIRACQEKHVRRLVYVSSIHAFEDKKRTEKMDERCAIDPAKTSGSYGKSKAMATLKVEEAIRQGLNAIIVCPTGVIGPYDYKLSELGRLFIDVAKGSMPFCVHGTFDFVDVQDVAKGIMLAAQKGRTGERYILGGTQIEINDLIALIEEAAGTRQKRIFIPISIAYFASFFTSIHALLWKTKPRFTTYSIETVNMWNTYSHEKASREIGYYPRPIEKTVEETLDWLRQEGYLPARKPATPDVASYDKR